MVWITVALLTASLLCIAFAETRWLGITGVAILLLLHPLLFLALTVLGGVSLYVIHLYRRRRKDELPRLPHYGD